MPRKSPLHFIASDSNCIPLLSCQLNIFKILTTIQLQLDDIFIVDSELLRLRLTFLNIGKSRDLRFLF